MWCAVSRWLHCSKYEITGLAFSSVDPNYIYVQGVDYEVLCGQWRKSKKAFSFRGDSNWLGFSKLVVPIGIFWQDGVIRVAYLLLMFLRRIIQTLKRSFGFLMHTK
ncbi:hypothetical protein OROHE_022426 [Orobanche hederae]